MNIGLIIVLILLGLVLLILEVLVIPGGIVGIIGCLMIIGGIVGSYVEYGIMIGNITLVATIVVCIVVIVLTLRTKTWRKLMLKTNIDSKVNEIDESKIQIGVEGVALSRLAPMGKGKFNGEVVEVSSTHGFIDVNSPIVVTGIEGNKVFVKLK